MSQQLAGQSGGAAPCPEPYSVLHAPVGREVRCHPASPNQKTLSTAPPPFNVNSPPHEDVLFTAVHLRRPQLHESAHTLSPPYHVRVLLENDLRIIPGISVLYILNAPFLLKLYGYIQNEEKILAISRNFLKNFFEGECGRDLIFFKDVAYNNLNHLRETIF